MSTVTRIEWTELTWNPVTGCTKLSQGCKHCYAESIAKRFWGGRAFTDVQVHEDRLDQPRRWRKGRTVFVNSMSDLFHESVPVEFIARVFAVMRECPQHTFQVLTKRAERLAELAPSLPWSANVWIGVSVEDERVVGRIDLLRNVPAAVRFLSLEPLIGPLPRLTLGGIDWAIVGGESGHGARPMRREWVEAIFRQCRAAGVPFFFKQWGGVRKASTGRELHGRTYDEYPEPRLALA